MAYIPQPVGAKMPDHTLYDDDCDCDLDCDLDCDCPQQACSASDDDGDGAVLETKAAPSTPLSSSISSSADERLSVCMRICAGSGCRLDATLGQGAGGAAYLVSLHNGNGSNAVIKISQDERLFGMEKTAREQMGTVTEHACIAQCHETISLRLPEGFFGVFVMEYCSGGTLERLVRRYRAFEAPEGFLVSIAKPMLRAALFLESRGLIHGDIKPDNYMLTTDQAPYGIKQIDFDRCIPRCKGEFEAETVANGNDLFKSPERTLGMPFSTNTESFSIGLMLYAIATGVGNFLDATTRDSLDHIHWSLKHKPEEFFAYLEMLYSRGFVKFLKAALCHDPQKRKYVGELLEMIEML